MSRFPDPREVPGDAPAVMGGELGVDWLLDAYAHGYFPWFSEGEPIFWWCPDPRFVLRPSEIKISRSLAKELKKPRWTVTCDTVFPEVIQHCAQIKRRDQGGTWIIDSMIEAYTALHEAGFAHSVECWSEGKLVGGLYGVSLGDVFFGESMFHLEPNASKVAFATLVGHLQKQQFSLIDCQQPTNYLRSFGATEWGRDCFLDELARGVSQETKLGPWKI